MSRASASPAASSSSACACAFEDELDYVYRTFRRLGAHPAEAEDLAQDVFVVMCRRWHTFRPDRPLRPWLAGIAYHVARDHFRKHSRREVATLVIEREDDAPGPEDQLASARARQLALRALAALPERHRSVLIRHELDGLTLRDIADEWSLPLFTVAARLRRARLRFAKAVKRLQLRATTRAVLVPAGAILAAERPAPRVAPEVRARIREQLTFPARELPTSWPPTAGPRAPRLPRLVWLAVAVVAVGVLFALALALDRRGATGPARGTEARVSQPAARTHTQRLWPPGKFIPALPALAPPATDSPAPAPEGLARGLVAHWRFEDGPGSDVARDSSGNGRSCLLHDLDVDTAWVAGPVGGALDLGRTGWLECPLPETRASAPFELSIGVWIKRDVQRRRDAVLFTRQLPSLDASHFYWFGVRDDFLALWSWTWTGWTTGSLPSLADWTHVAFVHGGGETRLYVNGVLARHKTNQVPRADGLVQSALTIGGSRFGADPLRVHHHFDGLVDEAVIYDRMLSAAEIATLARRGN